MSLLIIRFHNKNNAFSSQNFDDYMGIKHVLISISAFEEFDELCFEFGVEPEEPVCINNILPPFDSYRFAFLILNCSY